MSFQPIFIFRCSEIAWAWHRSYETPAGCFSPPKNTKRSFSLSKLIIQPSSPPVTTQTSSPSACLPFSPVSIPSTSPLLSCHSHAPTTKVPRCLKSPALISSSKKGDPRGIRLTNHCLKPLWAHRPRDKDSRELYSALAGLSGCLCRDWQARLFLRWKIAAGQPTASCLSISQSEKFHHNL